MVGGEVEEEEVWRDTAAERPERPAPMMRTSTVSVMAGCVRMHLATGQWKEWEGIENGGVVRFYSMSWHKTTHNDRPGKQGVKMRNFVGDMAYIAS